MRGRLRRGERKFGVFSKRKIRWKILGPGKHRRQESIRNGAWNGFESDLVFTWAMPYEVWLFGTLYSVHLGQG